jgi:hypothetical protein
LIAIDAKEQAQLDNMQAIIKKAVVKIADMEKMGAEKGNNASNPAAESNEGGKYVYQDVTK